MLQFFRNMFKSKIGLAIALAFIGLIGIAFATGDVSSTANLGGLGGADQVAVVGDTKISANDLAQAVNDELEQARSQNPALTMQQFVAAGGLKTALDGLIDRAVLREYAQDHGYRAGANLVNSEIRKIPAFRGPNGEFSEEAYRQLLAQQGVSDKQLRQDIETSLLARQLLLPATLGTRVPDTLALKYAQLFKERRKGAVATLPAQAFAPASGPSAQQLTAFYNDNRGRFVRPERRVIRYATFDAASLGSAAEPTEAEVAARYKRDAAQYAARETRSFTQLIVPTQAAAQAIRAKVVAGGTLESAATAAGLRTAQIKDVQQSQLRGQFSAGVAQAYFAAARGSITAPVRSPLGWHVARVDSVAGTPARTLDQARGAIVEQLRTEKRSVGLADRASQIESMIDSGATFDEVARELKLTVARTPPVVANGLIYEGQGKRVSEVVAPALATAFQMDEQEPEVTALPGGATYLVFDVATITPAATAPLKEIGPQVTAAWRLAEGEKAARAAADAIIAELGKGRTLEQALAARRISGTKVERFDLTRQQLASLGGERVPPALALMFSMAQNSAKKLAMGGQQGWLVVDLDSILVEAITRDDPLVAQAKVQLGEIAGGEYAEQLRTAMREVVGIERNEAAVTAVRKQLLGQN